MRNIPIGEVLKEYGYISEEQLQQALILQKQDRSKRLGTIMIEKGFITEKQMLSALAERLNQPLIDLSTYQVDSEAVELVPQQIAQKYSLIAIKKEAGSLIVATSDPLNFYAIEDVRQIVGMPLIVNLALQKDVYHAIGYYYAEFEAKKAATEANKSVIDDEMSLTSIFNAEEDETPVVKVLNSLLVRGYNTNASDIHIEPTKSKTMVRMRIDGTMVDYVQLDRSLHNSLIARTKILANLDIAEKRAPQDGHFVLKIENYEMNLRVSLIPTIYGEKAVLRYLNTNTPISNARYFGMSEKHYEELVDMLRAPHGIIYITGPTGSGKTTTLHAILKRIAQENRLHVVSLEDPIEIFDDSYLQLQINEAGGFTYEEGIKELLRHDPDVIMIGEIRDPSTARMLLRCALSGHLIFTTIHAKCCSEAIKRLLEFGLRREELYHTLSAVCAQRLYKKKGTQERVCIYEILEQNELDAYFREEQLPQQHRDIFQEIQLAVSKGIVAQEEAVIDLPYAQ